MFHVDAGLGENEEMMGRDMAVIAVCMLAGALPAGAGGKASNLLANADFELRDGIRPVQWNYFASGGADPAGLLDRSARTGCQALILSAQGKSKAFRGVVQQVDIVPGQKYSMSAYVHACATNPLDGTAYGQLVIEWQDAQGVEISRVWGKAWGRSSSRIRWQKVEIEDAEAPAGAAKAAFGIHLYDGPGKGRGAVVVDDVAVAGPAVAQTSYATERSRPQK